MSRSFVRLSSPALRETPVMGEINTTPLIDVMLVLLIMMILTVPITTHKVPLDLPGQGVPGEAPPVHRLSLDARGALAWDGMAIAPEALPGRLEAMTRDPARPILHLKAEAETPYLRFDETLAEVKRAGITRLGLVGNERFVE
jgi:biopolymer transport protein ExbD